MSYPPGVYQLEYKGQREVVEVHMTMQGQGRSNLPDKLMAHPISGPPRFPWSISELLEGGATLTRLDRGDYD